MTKLNYFSIVFVLLVAIACQNTTSTINNPTFSELPDSVKIDSLSVLIKENPKKASLYAERSEVNFNLGNTNQAITDLHLANAIDSLNPQYYIQLSDYYLLLGKSEVVNRLLLKANALSVDNKEILYRLGNLHFYIKDYKKATAFLNHAKSIDPYYAPVYFTKALILKELGDTAQAVENLQIAVEREPNYYDAYMQLGLLYSVKPDSIAIDYFDNALRIIPNSYEALYGKGYFYQSINKPNQAKKVYIQMLDELANDLPQVHYNLGYIEMLFYANYKQAIQYFDSALVITADYPDALCNKAYCYEQLGNKTEARKAYKKTLELIPNYEIAILGLNRLDKN